MGREGARGEEQRETGINEVGERWLGETVAKWRKSGRNSPKNS